MVIRIGRAETADIRSDSPAVELEHAVIENGTIIDRGSVTGTYVNETKIESAELHPGDRITIGDLHIDVREVSPLDLHVETRPLVHAPQAASRPVSKALISILLAAAAAGMLATVSRTALAPGSLSSAHQRMRALDRCESCHTPFQRVSDAKCRACHEAKAHATVAVSSCAACHPEHRNQQFVADRQCTGCHGRTHKEFTPARAIEHVALQGEACQDCHDMSATKTKFFADAKFTHAKHNRIACTKCHGSDPSLPTQNVCAECHGARAHVAASPCVTCHLYHG